MSKLQFQRPDEKMVNYEEYLEIVYPKKREADIKDKVQRAAENEKLKKIRIEKMNKFVNKGEPGEIFHDDYHNILKKMKVPDEVLEKVKNGETDEVFKTLYKQGYSFVFQSLFTAMIKLQQEGRDFAIIFRSFGTDSDFVVKEFNAFCQGKHPLFNGERKSFPKVYFDGTHGSKNYMISLEHCGLFYRYSIDIQHISLVLGVFERLKNKPFDLVYEYKEQIKQGKVKVINGGLKIYNFILDNVVSGNVNSFVLGDEYFIWFQNDERTEYSKVLLHNPYDFSVHQIFFDDNITENEHSIVDCRNVVTGKTMPREEIWNKFIVKADSIKAGTDPNYYYDCIKKAEELRKEEFENLNVTKVYNTTTKKNLEKIINEGIELYEKEGKKEQSIGEFFGNYVLANQSLIEKVIH